MQYIFTARTVTAAAAVALVGFWSTFITTTPQDSASVTLQPASATTVVGEPFTVDVVVQSDVPANAYSGLLTFDHTVLNVEAISYNTSIADLWVTEPWYQNGDGTISFAGGTTKAGAFQGEGTLLTITFVPVAVGEGSVDIADAHVLAHNGFGSELQLKPTVDALFTDASLAEDADTLGSSQGSSRFSSLPTPPQYDLNNDGVVDIKDISMFMPQLFTNTAKFDFNRDGNVNLSDFSMLLDARN